MSAPLRLACFISGGGRTLMNIADRIDDGTLNARIELVISSRGDAAGVQKSRQRGFNTLVIRRKDYPSDEEMHNAITRQLIERRIDLVCLCGYLRHVRVDPPFQWKIMNIHPALLPDFGGPGMFGEHVHRAVLASGKKTTGCTVHFVNDQYDMGPIIVQKSVPVLPGDDEHSLAARVFKQECIAYPEAISRFAAGQLRIVGDKVEIASA